VLLRLLVDEEDATAWNAEQRFTVEVRASRPFLAGGRTYVSERGPCVPHGNHTEFLEGPLGADRPPAASEDRGATVWQWSGLRITHGGAYSACWCWTEEVLPEPDFPRCAVAAHFDISGPTRLLWHDAPASATLASGGDLSASLAFAPVPADASAAGAAYAKEAFGLAVELQYLRAAEAVAARIRIVGFEAPCGGNLSDDGLLHHGLLQGGPLASPEGVLVDNGTHLPQLAWHRLVFKRGGLFRVCWCSGVRLTDAGLLNISQLVDLSAPRVPLPEEAGGSNASVSSTTTTPTVEESENASIAVLEDNATSSDGEAAERPLLAQRFGCSPGAFAVDLGGLAVAGPERFELQMHGNRVPTYYVNANVVFELTVVGRSLGEGEQRVRILWSEDLPAGCGGPGSSNSTSFLEGPLAEDPELAGGSRAGGVQNVTTAEEQTWAGLRLVEQGTYRVCWCSGMARPCQADDDFNIDLGDFQVKWRNIQLLDDGGRHLRVRPDAAFNLVLDGAEVTVRTRIRIVELGVRCGSREAMVNTPTLRGSLAKEPDLAGIPRGPGLTGLTWPKLRLVTGGLRRICWCHGERTDCTSPDQYYEAGTFAALKIRAAWPEPCARARKPFRIHIAVVGLVPGIDRVLLARASDTCGEAAPRGLVPGGEVAHDFGTDGLICEEDPNAGAELGERKMVCGDGTSSIQAISPGVYRICLCAALPEYDCSDYTHYRNAAGEPFEIAAASTKQSAQDAAGGGAPVPMVINGPSSVVAAAYAPQPWGPGRIVAAASEDGVVRLWEIGVTHPHMVAELVGHTDRINAVVWDPLGTWLLTADAPGTLRLWSTAAGIGSREGPPHICPRWKEVWERPLAGVSDEVWQDAILGHVIDVLPLNVSEELPRAYLQDLPSFSDLSDWRTLSLKLAAKQCEKACALYREMALPMCDCGPLMECHLEHTCVPKCGLEAHTWHKAHHLRITSVAASPDGRFVASASMDGTVRLWDVVSLAEEPVATIRSHERSVLSAAFAPLEFSPGGLILATGGDDNTLFWHNITEVAARPGALNISSVRFSHPLGRGKSVISVAFSPNGRWFAAAGSGVGVLWDAPSRTKVRELESSLPKGNAEVGQTAALVALAFASDSSYLALRGPTEVLMWPLGATADMPQDEWSAFGGDELSDALFAWTAGAGPENNRPLHKVSKATNGSVLEIFFTPCNVTQGCAEDLPHMQLDIETPFFFTAVRGSFVEFSAGAALVDDCRGGARHSDWSVPNVTRSYFTSLATNHEARGPDCRRVGPQGDAGRGSVEACQQECLASPVCNLINFRQHPANCELRRCLDSTGPLLTEKPDIGVWGLVKRDEAEERQDAPHDGYVMFGAPDDTGRDGVLYGGCGAGPEISREGVLIELPEREVRRTRRLRFEVGQSGPGETLGIRSIRLELRRIVQGLRFLADVAPSPAISFAPAGRMEMVATMGWHGDLVLFDLRGFNFPKDRHAQYKLKSMFSFDVEAIGLQQIDRMRVVDATAVYSCGDPYSATNTRALQGVGIGERASGNETYSKWDKMAIIQPGSYRACFCTGRPHTCCDADQDFATEILGFVAAGADPGHYMVCEATLDGDARSCKIEGFTGVGLQTGDMLMVQDTVTCGMATGHIAGIPKVMTSRPTQQRDFQMDGSSPRWSGGQYFRMETARPGDVFDPLKVTVKPGITARLCWCGKYDNCNPDVPADFQRDAGAITIVRLEAELKVTCMIKGLCRALVTLATSAPIGVGDQLMVKSGTANLKSRLECQGTPLPVLGPKSDGRSGRMKLDSDPNIGVFDFGETKGDVGGYILCWCQASFRPCLSPADFGFHVGSLTITSPEYVWPACTDKEQAFAGWRVWENFDDCCCNYAAAGAVGCLNENSVAFAKCSALPAR